MAETEDFLTRWSRRKRGAGVEADVDSGAGGEERTGQQPVTADVQAQRAQQTNEPSDESKPEQAFDLSKLPSLDSIGPASDIRAFLQPGVPEVLSRAALRRAWSADPAIRDFIGLSENSWDFTASDGMHGFGALDPADAKRLISQLLGGEDSKDQPVAAASTNSREGSGEPEHENVHTGERIPAQTDVAAGPCSEETTGRTGDATEPANASADVAMQDDNDATQHETALPLPRHHGSALPQ
jgi:hypothetical protein